MELHLPDRTIYSFSVIYRDDTVQTHNYSELSDFIKFSEEYKHTGLLHFESNRGNVEPWTVGQELLSKTSTLIPFIAVNPVYMHPFLAAKKIMALCYFYNRRVFINFITGTSKSDLHNLNDMLEHDQRYERLVEYIKIVDWLLRNSRPLNFSGKYYTVRNLLLSSRIPEELMPRFFIAGSSEIAEKARGEVGAFKASMGKDVSSWQKDKLLPSEGRGVHFGIIARETQEMADHALDKWLKGSEMSKDYFDQSMKNTDGEWKKKLNNHTDPCRGAFNLKPLKSLKSDCPYYVASYNDAAEVLVKYILNGYDTLITEVSEASQEFEHISIVFKRAEDILLNNYYTTQFKSFEFSF
jgi:alkanesulfonate monooxygenase